MISFVCGQLCSGKTVYSKSLSDITQSAYVEVGDIVRELKNSQNRRELQNSKDLSNKIVQVLNNKAIEFNNNIVVSGVRQKELLNSFPDATLLWIECPKEVRKQRYLKRKRNGDTQTFEEAEQGDIELGILEVKQYILNKQ